MSTALKKNHQTSISSNTQVMNYFRHLVEGRAGDLVPSQCLNDGEENLSLGQYLSILDQEIHLYDDIQQDQLEQIERQASTLHFFLFIIHEEKDTNEYWQNFLNCNYGSFLHMIASDYPLHEHKIKDFCYQSDRNPKAVKSLDSITLGDLFMTCWAQTHAFWWPDTNIFDYEERIQNAYLLTLHGLFFPIMTAIHSGLHTPAEGQNNKKGLKPESLALSETY